MASRFANLDPILVGLAQQRQDHHEDSVKKLQLKLIDYKLTDITVRHTERYSMWSGRVLLNTQQSSISC